MNHFKTASASGQFRFLKRSIACGCLLLSFLTALGQERIPVDSIAAVQSDSILQEISQTGPFEASDTSVPAVDTIAPFKPVPSKSVWFAALFPGLGQIYNHRYWKLPIVAGAAVGVTYAISWNNKYYEAYTYAYRDMTDKDPNTNYHIKLLGTNADAQQTLVKNRQQTFRRQRDLSIIIGAACYLLSILDAYVDAELFNFDISEDISLELGHPVQSPVVSSPWFEQQLSLNQTTPISFSWSFRF